MAEAQSLAATLPSLPDPEASYLELNRQRRQAPELERPPEGPDPAGGGAAGASRVDQAIGRESRDQRMASMMQTARSPSRQEKAGGAGEKGGGEKSGGGPTLGGIAGALGGGKTAALAGAAGKGNLAGGIEKMKQQIGAAIIKSCWANLLLSFGHTIWVIDLLFLLGWSSKYMRKYIPEVGMEWLPQDLRDKLPRAAVLPLKLGEIIAMLFVSFFIGMIDVLILAQIILLISLLMAVGSGLSNIT